MSESSTRGEAGGFHFANSVAKGGEVYERISGLALYCELK